MAALSQSYAVCAGVDFFKKIDTILTENFKRNWPWIGLAMYCAWATSKIRASR